VRSRRLTLFRNPGSGSGEADEAPTLLRWHGASVQVRDLSEVDLPLPAGTERVAVAGGDGSIAAVAARVAGTGLPLAVIPSGTANDFARAAGLPGDLGEAARLAVAGARIRRLDLCYMGKRPFVNVASVGLAPAAAAKARGLKRALGPVAYAVGGMRAALGASPVRCRARCEGRPAFEGRAWQVTVAGSGAFGAGAEVPARADDGELDLVAIEAGARLELVRRAVGLRRGTIAGQPGVHTARGRRIELDVAEGTTFNVDGEIVESGPAVFTVEPGAVELVVP